MKQYLYHVNSWWTTDKIPSEYQNTIYREKTPEIENYIHDREILILIGPRRSGKTTIIYQLINSLLKSSIKAKNILYISLDDPEITLNIEKSLFIDLFELYQEIISRELKDEKLYIFIDEIQYYKGWEMWLKKYFDKFPNMKFIVSGSSSLTIKDESAALTGRNLTFLIYPFSFREYLLAKDNIRMEKTTFEFESFDDAYTAVIPLGNKLKLEFLEYLRCGGYPRIIAEDTGKSQELLKQYLYDTIYKDILKIYTVKDVRALESIAIFLAHNIGNRFSYRKISSSLSIDIDTTIRYIRYIEETYLFFLVNFFSFSSRAVMQKEKKVYLIDTGLANALSISINEPALVENCVFTHLMRTFKYISYWRDVEEVDFVINIDNVPIPVEVKYRNKIERKYTRSVVKFCRKFNVNKGVIVTKNDLKKEIIDEVEIWFIPVWLFIAVI